MAVVGAINFSHALRHRYWSQRRSNRNNSSGQVNNTYSDYTFENYINIENLNQYEYIINPQGMPDIQNLTSNEASQTFNDLTSVSDFTSISNLPNIGDSTNINSLGRRTSEYLLLVAPLLITLLIAYGCCQFGSKYHSRKHRNRRHVEQDTLGTNQNGSIVNIVMVSGVEGVNSNGSRLRYTQGNAETSGRFSLQQGDVAAAPAILAAPAVPDVPVVPYSCGCVKEHCRNRRCGCRKRGLPCNNGCHKGIEGYPCQNRDNAHIE